MEQMIRINSTNIVNDGYKVNFSVNFPEELNFSGSMILSLDKIEEMSMADIKKELISKLASKISK